MSFPELRKTLVDSVFATLGEDALWNDGDQPVRVRRMEYDDDARFGSVATVSIVRFLRVRRSEIAAPEVGNRVRVLDLSGDTDGESYRVSGEPLLRRNAVWSMPIEPIPA